MTNTARWEVRSALRYGSKHVCFYNTPKEAKDHAYAEIKKAGEGKIELVDNAHRIIYYTIYPEEC